MPGEGFAAFRELVFADAALLEELRQAPDRQTLIARTLSLGAERGYQFSEQDLQAEEQQNRRGWLERFLYQ